MRDDCLEIGTVQAFMDGELAHKESARVSGHLAACDVCAMMLSVAEDEAAIVFPALEREFNSLVPTQRLWNKINDSITIDRKNKPFWQRAWAFVSGGLLTPSMAAAASLIIVVGVVSLALINRRLTVDTSRVPRTTTIPSNPSSGPNPLTTAPPSIVGREIADPPAKAERVDYRPAGRHDGIVQPRAIADRGYMPGEESYVRTIASLSRSVADQKNATIKGSERMSFERDLAVVDDAITKMRSEVKRNPRNESAKQVLYSSYQNKIDLLSSVAQKEELVASLKQ